MNIDLKNFSKNVNEYNKIKDNTYQDILWIDDMDIQQAKISGQKLLFTYQWFPNNWEKINIIDSMDNSYEEIVADCDKYNLVIFDMNMENNELDVDYQSLQEKFLKYNISLPEEYDEADEKGNTFWQTAGIYLYLLLLTKGYPSDRMIIYTANSDSLKDSLKLICPALDLKITKKDKNKKIDLENYYQIESYYRIRRLVQQGCHYWKNKLESIRSSAENEKNIPFNKIYFSGNKRNRISIANFLELLDRVEMMFPVVPPENPDKVYYQAARILSEYHENSADIKKLNNYEDLYTFHLVCRSFRNWSSHNKFAKAEMTAKIFAVIFCIALRTYFDEKQNEDRHYVPKLKYYEEIYFSKKDISEKEYNNVCETIKNKLTENISLVKFFSSTKQDIQGNQGNKKYSHLVYIWGEENNKADVQDVLMPIIVKDKNIPIANNKLQELKVCSLLSANNFSAVNEQSEEEISGTQCIQEGISTDNEQSDEITFIDLIVRSSIELWLEKSAENKQEASS